MTVPSLVLDAIVQHLTAVVSGGSALERKVTVRAIDDTIVQDIVEYTTVPAPAILVTCLGWPVADSQGVPTMVDATFIARCTARLSDKPEGDTGIRSRGDVAMNLAALVTRLLDATEFWVDADGQPAACQRPMRVQARNFGNRALAQKGLSMWAVTWTQRLEITGEDEAQLLYPLRHFHVTIAQGGDDTPDQLIDLELEGATPP